MPADVQKARALEARAANEARVRGERGKNASKARMKGKNSATSRHRKRQDNVIEARTLPCRMICLIQFFPPASPAGETTAVQALPVVWGDVKRGAAVQDRKADVKERMREQKVQHDKQREARAEAKAALEEKLKSVPRALHRLHKRGQQ